MGIDDVLNQEILILDYKRGASKFKENSRYTTVQFELNGETRILFTGSEVIADQLDRYTGHMPFFATIRKINRYYTLT